MGKIKAFFTTLAVIMVMTAIRPGNISARPRLLGTRLITPNGQELMSLAKDTVYIEKARYAVQRWGIDRLKLTREGTHRGVFLKRFGAKLMIRDLSGNLLHIIRKEGGIFRVESPIGARLVFMKVSKKKVIIFRDEGKILYTLLPKFNSIQMKDKNGKPLYILKGDTGPYPAGFLCLPPLTPEERAACYLLFKKIPLDSQ